MKICLLHKAKIAILSRSSTLTEVEVKDMVHVKEVVVAMATKIKANNISILMMHKDQMQVVVDSPEARGRGCKKFHRNNADNDNKECWGCAETGHFERDYPSKNQSGRRQQNNYASTSRNTDDSERLFVM